MLLALEFYSRKKFPEPRLALNLVYDPVLGHRGPSGAVAQIGYFSTKYSQEGFRHAPSLESALPRVFFFGDSYTDAWSIPDQSVYMKVLERDFLKKTEVAGFGASDFGTLQEFLTYFHKAKRFSPKLVVLQFLPLNDFVNNELHFAEKNQALGDSLRPYMLPSGEITYLHPWQKWLRDHSHLFLTADSSIRAWLWSRPQKEIPCPPERGLFVRKKTAEWQQAIATTKRIIENFRNETEKNAAKFAIVSFPSSVEVSDDVWKDVQTSIHQCYGEAEYSRFEGEELIKTIAKDLKIPFLNLRPSFTKAAKKRESLFISDGHFNETGHALAAKTMAPFLQKLVPNL